MGRLVVGIELLVLVVALVFVASGGTLLIVISLVPLAFTAAVPLLGALMIWKGSEVAGAFRDAFGSQRPVGPRPASLRIWEFFERTAYLGGILGVLLSACAFLSRLGTMGSLDIKSLWIAVALFGLYTLLFTTLYRILHLVVLSLSKKPIRELDLTLSKAFRDAYSITDREREVIALILRGRRYHEIAGELFISIKTVKTHVYHVYEKTACRGRMDLIRLLQFKIEGES
jgi:DNA-binding CsgD family transcriptional regulator